MLRRWSLPIGDLEQGAWMQVLCRWSRTLGRPDRGGVRSVRIAVRSVWMAWGAKEAEGLENLLALVGDLL